MDIRKRTAGLALAGVLGLVGAAACPPAYAGKAPPPGLSALRLTVDKPIIHLGERIVVSGYHFTPGARVTITLHGPEAATLGRVYTRVRVAPSGDFSARLAIPTYPDAAARQWHTIVVAAASTALLNGAQEGGAVAVQADPMPGLAIVTKGRLARTSLVIDGTAVPSLVVARSATHYRISYVGHLRAGVHSAYLKWTDAAGGWGARAWSFRIGSPYAVAAAPSLTLSATRVRLGDSLGVAGKGFTPDATVAIRLGGPNSSPGTPIARAVVDANGAFHLVIRVERYPSAGARLSRTLVIDVSASGAAVGDLPEGVALSVRVTG